MGIFGDFNVNVIQPPASVMSQDSKQGKLQGEMLAYSKTPGKLDDMSAAKKTYVFESNVSIRENVEALNSTPKISTK